MQVGVQVDLVPWSSEETLPVVQLLVVVDMYAGQELALSLATEVVADLLGHGGAGVGWRTGLRGAAHLVESKVKGWNEHVELGQVWGLRHMQGTGSARGLQRWTNIEHINININISIHTVTSLNTHIPKSPKFPSGLIKYPSIYLSIIYIHLNTYTNQSEQTISSDINHIYHIV